MLRLGMNSIQLAHGSWSTCCRAFVNPALSYILSIGNLTPLYRYDVIDCIQLGEEEVTGGW